MHAKVMAVDRVHEHSGVFGVVPASNSCVVGPQMFKGCTETDLAA